MDDARAAAPSFSPLDEELELLPGAWSPSLQEVTVLLGATMPFARVSTVLQRTLGVHLSTSSARRITMASGASLVEVEAAEVAAIERVLPPVPDGPKRQQVSVDGAMVPVLGGDWREVKTMVIGELAEPTSARTSAHSYCSRLTDIEGFTHITTGELHRRGTFAADLVVGVADGAVWCQHFYDHHLPRAIRILDYPHVIEHLATAAHACWGEGSEQATTWLATQSQTLRHGDTQTVIDAVAALPVTHSADHMAAQLVCERVRAYLQPRHAHMAYAEFIAQGLPIASGIVESANKRVVENRLKGAGMHWKVDHVNPMLALSCALYSQTWDDRWASLAQHRRAAARRSSPRSASHPPAPTPVPVSPHVIPPPPPPDRSKTIVNGKPTLDHPWKHSYRQRYGTTDRAASQTITKT